MFCGNTVAYRVYGHRTIVNDHLSFARKVFPQDRSIVSNVKWQTFIVLYVNLRACDFFSLLQRILMFCVTSSARFAWFIVLRSFWSGTFWWTYIRWSVKRVQVCWWNTQWSNWKNVFFIHSFESFPQILLKISSYRSECFLVCIPWWKPLIRRAEYLKNNLIFIFLKVHQETCYNFGILFISKILGYCGKIVNIPGSFVLFFPIEGLIKVE